MGFKLKAVALACFVAGILATLSVSSVRAFYREVECGNIKGHTTHAVMEEGDLICLYRKNSYPFRVWGGRA